MDQYVKFDSRVVALAETLMSAGLIYVSKDSDKKKQKPLLMYSCYLLYGAYLNTQGRIKLLKDNKS